MNKLSAVARLRWLGLGGLVVTTATGPAIFMGVSDVSLEQRLPEGLMADVRPVAFGSASGADLVLSLLSDGSEPAPLLSMPSMRLIELASASLGYVADSGDRGIANRAYPDEGFASNGQFVGGNAGFGLDLPATANVATPEIGASSTAALAIATGSGGTPVAVHTAPRSLRAPSFSPDAALAVSVRSEIAILRVTSGVGRDGAMPAGRADQPSSSSPPPIGELGNRSSAESPADESRGESAGGTLFPGQTPDTMRTDTVLALESPDLLEAVLEQQPGDRAEENIVLAALTVPDVMSDASAATAQSAAPLQAQAGPNQVIAEPGTLALLGLGFGLAGLGFSRRKQ